jgi:long-subunit fatty acid transport protein
MRTPALAAALALGLAPVAARANPLDMYGFLSRSTALGGAVTADVGDVSAGYYNPAGLARLRAFRAEVGYLYASPSLTTDGRDNQVDATRGFVGGLVAPGRLFGLPFAFGLAVHVPDDRLSQVRALPQAQPRWELYSVRLQRLYIAASVAVSPWPWLRLGAGLVFMASTRGGFDISGRISATQPANSALTHGVDADLTAVRYLQVGAQVDLPANVTLGAAFRDEFRLDTALDADLQGQIVVGSINDPRALVVPGHYGLRSHVLTAFQPRQAVLGAVWRIAPALRVMADLMWVQWSRYENPTASLDVALDLTVPAGIPGLRQPTVPQPAAREAMRFRDTLVPRVGLEVTTPVGRHALAFRLGYHFDPSPVPAQAGLTNFIDASRHVAAFGVGITLHRLGAALPGTLTLDVHAAMQLLASRSVVKADPNDAVGDYLASGTVLNVGTTLAVGFE